MNREGSKVKKLKKKTPEIVPGVFFLPNKTTIYYELF